MLGQVRKHLLLRCIGCNEKTRNENRFKKISQHLKCVLDNAKQKVSVTGGCGEDTICYGYLRSFDNQFYHEILEEDLLISTMNYSDDIRSCFIYQVKGKNFIG